MATNAFDEWLKEPIRDRELVSTVARCGWENDMKRLVMAGIAALMLTAGSAATVSAMPLAPMAASADTIQIKGGHGHGHGHGHMHRGGRGHHYGWSRGRGHHYGWRHGRGHRHHW